MQTALTLANQLLAQIGGLFQHFGIDPLKALAVFCIGYLIFWAVT